MLLTLVLLLIAAALMSILTVATLFARRRKAHLRHAAEADQLQRRADHLFKIALAAQVHTPNSDIAKILLQEAIRVLGRVDELTPGREAAALSLRECQALLVTTGQNESTPAAGRDSVLEFPETELLEAQLHLTEASRLLMGLEKRGVITYDELAKLQASLTQAQRGLTLRLQLRQAAAGIGMERTVEQLGEYLAADRDKTPLSRS
jgi:hypothetical protein